jgi:hypothetical protein
MGRCARFLALLSLTLTCIPAVATAGPAEENPASAVEADSKRVLDAIRLRAESSRLSFPFARDELRDDALRAFVADAIKGPLETVLGGPAVVEIDANTVSICFAVAGPSRGEWSGTTPETVQAKIEAYTRNRSAAQGLTERWELAVAAACRTAFACEININVLCTIQDEGGSLDFLGSGPLLCVDTVSFDEASPDVLAGVAAARRPDFAAVCGRIHDAVTERGWIAQEEVRDEKKHTYRLQTPYKVSATKEWIVREYDVVGMSIETSGIALSVRHIVGKRKESERAFLECEAPSTKREQDMLEAVVAQIRRRDR